MKNLNIIGTDSITINNERLRELNLVLIKQNNRLSVYSRSDIIPYGAQVFRCATIKNEEIQPSCKYITIMSYTPK
jgi:hypothetical protein